MLALFKPNDWVDPPPPLVVALVPMFVAGSIAYAVIGTGYVATQVAAQGLMGLLPGHHS